MISMKNITPVFLLLIATSLFAEAPKSLYQLHFDRGMEQYKNNQRELARNSFLATIYLNPEHPGANYQLGLMAFTARNYSASIEFLKRASDGMPQNVELFYWLGKAYWAKELAEGAIESYKKAVNLDQKHKNKFSLYALENLAEVYTRTDRLQESLEMYQLALKRETRPHWLLKIKNQIAELHLTMGNYEPDETTRYNKTGEIIGGVGVGNMRTNKFFEVARHTNDPLKEEFYYRKALIADPDMYQSHFNLGWALIRQGRFREAIPVLERSDRVWRQDKIWNPNSLPKVDAHAFLALCYVETGNPQKAIEHAEIALAVDRDNYYARLHKAKALTKLGQLKSAQTILESLITVNPDAPIALHALYEAYQRGGKSAFALAALRQAIRAQNDPRKKKAWQLELQKKQLMPR